MKKFFVWIQRKKKLDEATHKPPFVSQGDIWWISIGENIGSEINGKSNLFSRPVIILKKLTPGFYFAIPTSTQVREGSWYVPFSQNGKEMVACLHQARAVDFKRLSTKLGSLSNMDLSRVKKGFASLYI